MIIVDMQYHLGPLAPTSVYTFDGPSLNLKYLTKDHTTKDATYNHHFHGSESETIPITQA